MKFDKNMYEKAMKGTTTIGIVCSDGIVLGSDSRATAGYSIASSDVRKVFKIDNNLGITTAGGVGDALELIRMLKAQNEIYKMEEGRSLSPKSTTSLLSIILQQNKMMPFYVQLIVGGMDGDQPQLYSLDPFGGSVEELRFTSTGSGSDAALGYIEDAYRKGMSTKDAAKIAAKALAIAIKRDSATGDHINITVITKSGYVEYSDKDIDKFTAAK